MATISLTDIVFNTDLESATVNSIFAEIESFLNGSTASADITITGTMTAAQFQTSVDGTSVASDGSYTMGSGDDAGIYWDGTEVVLDVSSALTSTPQYLTIKHTTSGTPASGIGIGLKYIVETSAGNNETGAILDVITTDVTGASEDFDFVIKLMTGGSAASEIARFQSDGKLDLVSGAEYQINGTDVLSSTVLGTGVVTSSLTTVGALNSGSITSGFGAINNGASAITTTGLITGGNLTVDNLNINGNTISSTSGDINITPVAGSSVNVELSEFDGGFVSLGSLGTVSSPALSFVGDLNTGMYSSGANILDFAADGVNRLTLNSLGATVNGGVFLGSLGTVSSPALSFVGDLNTGMYSSGANILDFAADGVNRLTLNSLGATVNGGVFLGSLGTVSLPALSFVGDLNTGMYSSGADTIDISTGGSNRFSMSTTSMAISVDTSITGDFTVDTNVFYVDSTNNNAAIGRATTGSGFSKLTIDQAGTTAAIPCLELIQKDVDNPFINLNTTVGAGNALEADSGETAAKYGVMKINVSGVGTKYIRIYDGVG